MKKTLSLILALLMGVSCASGIFAEEVMPIDAIAEDGVVENADYSEAAAFLDHYEIMKGKGEGDLALEDAVKRYEMALLVARVSTGWLTDTQWINGDANDSEFTDLAGTGAENCYGALSYANQKGIVIGYGDGIFKPEKGVSYRDALTMAVRTLGYNSGLEYPWDYIEKAVALGLTDKIDGVAYTEEINRGVVAQIVYNMMFAAKKDGSTLAMDIFGIEFGWENIMITANTRGVYEAGAKETKEGVAFKVVLEDGTLDENVYYVDGDYELGRIYKALFEIDDEDDFVTLYVAKEYDAELIENKGLTDDAAVENDDVLAINTYLDDYTLVSKYNVKNLTNPGKLNREIIVANAYEQATVLGVKEDKATPYAIDWATGDILVQVKKDDKYVDGEYEVAWYYNEKYDYFFRLAEDKVVSGVEDVLVGIEIMDEDDVKEIKEAIAKALEDPKTVDSFAIAEKIGKSAYASLEVYDFDENGFGDYAIYEAYQLGYFSNSTAKCSEDKDESASYKFSALVVDEVKDVKGYDTTVYNEKTVACDHYEDAAVFAEGFEPSVDADGKYVEGYVIYGYNKTTNEFKIIKEIGKLGENTDADSYWTTGIVRGYSMTNKTVTIDNDNISFDYPNLKGTAFVNVKDNKGAYTDYFDRLFNQFVKYLVVDGVVVYIETVGDTDDEYIVVDDYYGIDSDNKIVVAGYSTTDLKYDTFRIESFNGWKNGDFFFYRDAIEDEFVKGNVYKITSHDEENDLYFVESISYFSETQWVWVDLDEDGDIEDDEFVVAPWNTNSRVDVDEIDDVIENATVSYLEGNYREVVIDNESTTLRMQDTDKYIIIGDPESKLRNYMPIYVYEGRLDRNWTVTGDIIVGDADDRTLIIVNPTRIVGFNRDTYDTGYVVVLDNKILDRNYNGYGKDYYVYGATTNTVEVFNLLTTKSDEVRYNTNLELEEGFIYRTISDTIVSDARLNWFGFMNDMDGIGYVDDDEDTAKYYTRIFDFVEDYLGDDGEATFSEDFVAGTVFPNLTTGRYDDLVHNYTVKSVTLADDNTVTAIETFDADAWAEFEEDNDVDVDAFEAFVIYEFETEDAIVYVNLSEFDWTDTVTEPATSINRVELIEDDAFIDISATVTKTIVNDEVTAVKLNSITLDHNGDATEGMHSEIKAHGLYFGNKGTCDAQAWHTTLSFEGAADEIYTDIVTAVYDSEHELYCEETICKLVEAVTLVLDKDLEVDEDYFGRISFNGYSLPFVIEVDEDGDVTIGFNANTNQPHLNKVWIDGAFTGTYDYVPVA